MLYNVAYGDSPAIIARKYGVTVDALIGANPQKPLTVVAGQRTWRDLRHGETVRVPVGGYIGDFLGAPADAVSALVAAGGPCLQANVALVCAAQHAVGVGADGKWGTDTSTAARRYVPSAPPGCTPRPAWWAPAGQSNCPAALPATAPAAAPSASPAAASTAPAAVQALASLDPCAAANAAAVCAAQSAMGLGPDGKYGTDSATAAGNRIGALAPPPCSPRPSWWAPSGQTNCGHAAPAPSPSPVPAAPAPAPVPLPVAPTAPAAVQVLAAIDPCAPSSAMAVCAAQHALGIGSDGKYGTDTATAARRFIPSAPPGCTPRPTWWAAAGHSNCGAASPPAPAPSPIPLNPLPPGPQPVTVNCPFGTALNPLTGNCDPIPQPPPPPGPAPAPSPGPAPGPAPAPAPSGGGGAIIPGGGGAGPAITAPAQGGMGGISTGAIVAASVGAVALVGIIAAASMSGKGGAGRAGRAGHAGHRGKPGKTTHRKPAHKGKHKKR